MEEQQEEPALETTVAASIFDLPRQIWVYHIFCELSLKDLAIVQRTCKYFYQLGSTEVLWKDLLLKFYKVRIFNFVHRSVRRFENSVEAVDGNLRLSG